MIREVIQISTQRREELIDITAEVASVIRKSGVNDGLVAVYAQGKA